MVVGAHRRRAWSLRSRIKIQIGGLTQRTAAQAHLTPVKRTVTVMGLVMSAITVSMWQTRLKQTETLVDRQGNSATSVLTGLNL